MLVVRIYSNEKKEVVIPDSFGLTGDFLWDIHFSQIVAARRYDVYKLVKEEYFFSLNQSILKFISDVLKYIRRGIKPPGKDIIIHDGKYLKVIYHRKFFAKEVGSYKIRKIGYLEFKGFIDDKIVYEAFLFDEDNLLFEILDRWFTLTESAKAQR